MTNTSDLTQTSKSVARLVDIIGEPTRIQILLILKTREACVCHFEAALGMRQASISQHLMVLRKAGFVSTVRDGRNIFYHLEIPEIATLLESAAQITGCDIEELRSLAARPIPGCPCPQCNPDSDPTTSCQRMHIQKN